MTEPLVKRIEEMAARPAMWASTREAFGLQLVLLVEMARSARGAAFDREGAMRAVFGPGSDIGDGYDESWARSAAAAARDLVEEAGTCFRCRGPADLYMVDNALWHAHGAGDYELCTGCLQERMGRPLRWDDFVLCEATLTNPIAHTLISEALRATAPDVHASVNRRIRRGRRRRADK